MKKLRSALGQSEFAKEVGIPQSKVSECEAGKPPSVQMFVLLGNYAAKQGLFEDATWFWRRAGLDTEAMLSAASRLLAKKNAPAGIATIPLMANIVGQEKAESAPILNADRSVIPNPEDTYYVRVPTESFVIKALRCGDFVVIDSSETNPWKLEGCLIAAYRSPELKDEQSQIEFVKSNTKEEVDERRTLGIHPFRRFGLFIGFLLPERLGETAHLCVSGLVSGRVEISEPVAFWSDYYVRRDAADRGPAIGIKVLGRVLSLIHSEVGWQAKDR
jgi:hypothetical protein